MRVAMITPGLLPVPAVCGGAVEVLTEYLIDGNEKQHNYEIDLYTIYDERLDNYHYNNTNIVYVRIHFWTRIKNVITNTYYRLFKKRKWKTSYNREVIKFLKKRKYDLVVIQNNILIYEDIYYMTNNKNNIVYMVHNNLNDGDETHMRIAKFMGDTAFKILAVSNFTKNNLLKLNNKAPVEVLYNCIDTDMYLKSNRDNKRYEKRKKYGIKESEYVFIYSGRIDKHKGVLELVKAFSKIDRDNIVLMIVGESWFDNKKNSDSYIELIKKQGTNLKGRIVFTGLINVDQMPYMYQAADCLIIPSLWEEPFGVVALEGMISKLPIIATKSGGLLEVLNNTKTIFIKKDDDVVEELTSAMNYVLKNKEKYNEYGKENFDLITKNDEYSKEYYFDNFINKIKGF